jgi:hypothetical protein
MASLEFALQLTVSLAIGYLRGVVLALGGSYAWHTWLARS